MGSLLDVIKSAAGNVVESGSPVHILYGKVIQASPLEVNVDQRFTLTADFLILTENVQRYELVIGAETYVIRKGLEAGDRVLMVRVQGGNRYVILDKVVGG
ncbi:DUF2577 domain-containing protein [Paenibacillus nasutitermitis]|uniref:DUF2577 domain-containing protein n=1 Tax=Paenibacillus nasutitermitis TaxID=1652958 RepID=A0A916ZG47_9BACL|nr:DUF2577 domain-containing protein [Paenibacillus nasutitermitis]GGD95177.1 hypothetical protein GCM10010911_62360 [Paenibacillus nasutitermitis]